MTATLTPRYYCLGNGASKCDGCKKEKNWQILEDMPAEWRKNAKARMIRINDDDCILNGRPHFE